jgi:alkylhydroperoxidase family enzyme
MLQCGAYSRFTFCSITATVATMACYKNDSARMAPAAEPLPEDIRHAVEAIMRGRPPLSLFTTLARDRRLFFKFFNAGLLDRGHLTIRQREIVIDRVTAACGAEYEWGVHVSVFATKAGLTEAQIMSLTEGGPDDACWTDADRVLIRLCDSLHDDCTVDDVLWAELTAHHSDETMLELLMLAGTYRTVSYLVNSLRLPPEPEARRFPLSRAN